MLIDEFLCKREVLGKRAPHSFTPPSKCGRCVQHNPTKLIKGQGLANLMAESNFHALDINFLAVVDEQGE
jgi:hypothetical protein